MRNQRRLRTFGLEAASLFFPERPEKPKRPNTPMKDFEEIYKKALRYCAYQERCLKDIRLKLRQWQASPEVSASVLQKLQDERFIDPERFARAYARGKFRMNGWGKRKIRLGLQAKGVEPALIAAVLKEEIDPEEYLARLRKILHEKGAQAAFRKGYEPDLLREAGCGTGWAGVNAGGMEDFEEMEMGPEEEDA